MKKIIILLILSVSLNGFTQEWTTLETIGESTPRGETSMVAIGSKLYLFGGRGMKPMEVYDTKTNTWEKKGELPLEIHHFQAVAYNGEIYVLGALTGPFPHETPIPNVYIYNPEKDEWRVGSEIPRKRGSAAVFVYKDKIYIVNGIIDGHWDGHVAWFDEFDPKTGTWRELPDSPHARDHVVAGVVKNQVVIAAGRKSKHRTGEVMTLTVPFTDIYDFKTNTWTTVENANIPTLRAGPGVATLGSKVLFMGGEAADQKVAHNEVEAFDLKTMKWTTLPNLIRGRHASGAAQVGNKIYISSGVGNAGGSPELNSLECYGCK